MAKLKTTLATALALLQCSCLVQAANRNHNNKNLQPSRIKGFLKHPFVNDHKHFASAVSDISGGASALLDGGTDIESIEVSIPLSQSPAVQANVEALLTDISMLTDILMDVIEHEDPNVRKLYDEFLSYGKAR